DRSGSNHGPRGGLVTRSLAVEYVRRWPVPRTLRSLPAISDKAAPPRRSPLSVSRCETARAGDAAGRRCSYCDAEEVWVMTTAVIGTGGIGSVLARELGSGG